MTEFYKDKWEGPEMYGRKYCPMCNATGKDLKEEEDLTKPLYYFGNFKRMYAKINVCKKCNYRWS